MQTLVVAKINNASIRIPGNTQKSSTLRDKTPKGPHHRDNNLSTHKRPPFLNILGGTNTDFVQSSDEDISRNIKSKDSFCDSTVAGKYEAAFTSSTTTTSDHVRRTNTMSNYGSTALFDDDFSLEDLDNPEEFAAWKPENYDPAMDSNLQPKRFGSVDRMTETVPKTTNLVYPKTRKGRKYSDSSVEDNFNDKEVSIFPKANKKTVTNDDPGKESYGPSCTRGYSPSYSGSCNHYAIKRSKKPSLHRWEIGDAVELKAGTMIDYGSITALNNNGTYDLEDIFTGEIIQKRVSKDQIVRGCNKVDFQVEIH